MPYSPMLTATLQATFLSSISNILGQIIDAYRQQKPFTFSILDLIRFQLFTLMSAPPNYQWQAWLERTFPGYPTTPAAQYSSDAINMEERGTSSRKLSSDSDRDLDNDHNQPHDSLISPPGSSDNENPRKLSALNWRNTALKWFIDCMTLGHLFNTTGFLLVMGLLKLQSPAEIADGFRREFWVLIIAGYKLWPVASVINFTLIPVERRIVFLSFVGLCYGIFLSIVAARV